MKSKLILAITLVVVALGALLAFTVPAHSATVTNETTLSEIDLTATNYTLNVVTNVTTSIGPRTTGRRWKLVILNTSTNRIYVATDGTTPSATNGEFLEPTSATSDDDEFVLDLHNTGTVTMRSSYSVTGTNAVNVKELFYTPSTTTTYP